MMNQIQEWLKNSRNRLYLLAAAVLTVGLVLIYFSTMGSVTIVVDGENQQVRTHAKTVSGILRSAGLSPQSDDFIYPALDQVLPEDSAVEVRRARPVVLTYDGEAQIVQTYEQSAGNILAFMDIELFPADMVWVDGIPLSGVEASAMIVKNRLEVQPAVTAAVSIDGSEKELWLGGSTLAEGLWRSGLRLVLADSVSENLSGPIPDNGSLEIARSYPVMFRIGGSQYPTRVLADTVAGAVEQAGVVLMGLDTTNQDEDNLPNEDKPIRVTRVIEEVVLDQEPLPFDVVYQADPESMIDTQSLLSAGEYGVQAERVRVRYEDGEETERILEGSWVAREPQPRVVGYGTKIEIRTLDTPDGPIEYWRAIEMEATSYSPSRAGVPDDYPYFGITACGIKAEKGVVAVDRTYIPFYTPLYIPGYGTAIACDTGGAIVGRKIDLGYDDDNWESWHWPVTVYFLTPVPDPANIAWIIP